MIKKVANVEFFCTCGVFVSLMLIVLVRIVVSMVVVVFDVDNEMTKWLLKDWTITAMVKDTTWAEEYPYEKSWLEEIEENIVMYEGVIESYCTSSFPGREKIHSLISLYKEELLGYKIDEVNGTKYNINYIQQPGKNVSNLYQFLRQNDIPFLYVQTPCKETMRYYSGDGEMLNDMTQRNAALSEYLEEQDIPVINVGKNMAGKQEYQFDASSHWGTREALGCAQLIANYLSEAEGYSICLEKFQVENFEDILEDYPNERALISDTFGYDYEILAPIREYEYTMTYANAETWSGDWKDVLLNPVEKWKTADKIAYHGVFRIQNSLFYTIKNESCKNELKCLVIGDSFNWPVSSYLSLGLAETCVIHNASFTGSIESFVEKYQPDIVVMCYNDAEFLSVYTEDAFYLE